MKNALIGTTLALGLPTISHAAVEPASAPRTCAFRTEVFVKGKAVVAIDHLSPTNLQHVAPPLLPIAEWGETWRGVIARHYDIFRYENGKLAQHWYSQDPAPSVGS